MPRKRRVAKIRRDFRADRLGFNDWFGLCVGWRPEDGEELKTWADVRECVRQNRHLLKMCDRSPACQEIHCLAFHYRPGTRPWWWWKFEKGFERRPREEESISLLEEMGEVTEEERAALKRHEDFLARVRGEVENSPGGNPE